MPGYKFKRSEHRAALKILANRFMSFSAKGKLKGVNNKAFTFSLGVTKHLMTGPTETVSFASPRPSMSASGNIEGLSKGHKQTRRWNT